ncbi:putative diphthamide biosynthesis protein Dph2 [Polychaeton citri CBS 116435]|uniref:2-(3-amino-3-carboxypropyl)histidine synthase subunit 2 n=1 Tax=Polychaeton citri CBS 116435 TaxID=1314669 RepID=A0A9P4QH37_9PEZI|nr:putative diphthamide biosynthesis protein Dph2 [Polychaeton citri CBS 116435]
MTRALPTMEATAAPVLSTPAEHILQESTPLAVQPSEARLSDRDLSKQYEIPRTVDEILARQCHRIALQFPDDMLVDAPRVYEHLRDGLRRAHAQPNKGSPTSASGLDGVESLAEKVGQASIADQGPGKGPGHMLTILGDTSYGACCVDEVAAEHVDADVVVHYGRACLSPTARLPVIYVYTAKPLDIDQAVESFTKTYPDKAERVCLIADIPYSTYVPDFGERLRELGYLNVFATEVLRDPASPLPNRSLPADVQQSQDKLREYSVFHISSPPTSLLLILSSRVNQIHIFDPNEGSSQATQASAAQLMRRRYALVTRLSTASVYGILINTLSVANYMDALSHVQDVIRRAGKKSYTFVVGKINAAKVANFAEIEGWVVIGCWESSLIESRDFWRPIVTPFELEMALAGDDSRTWGGDWVGDFTTLLDKHEDDKSDAQRITEVVPNDVRQSSGSSWDDQSSDDEPPEFDLRTGRYVSHTRPIGRSRPIPALNSSEEANERFTTRSTALLQKPKGDIAMVGGTVSPAAEFLRNKRTWQGLGSDHKIAYERDAQGNIIGAPVEEGRSGIARGYTVGNDVTKG